ncbi:MAG: hydrogenase expression/formation C-terminal domain-containing protein [Burkholderiaceae bacterium]|nr:hydrogenase expression/formation protein [Burkholderiaceae bacterium]
MSTSSGQRPFPIPLVSAMGPGSQIEDEELDYLPMPQGMSTYQPPRLPEPDALDGHGAAIAVLDQVLAVLQAAIRGESVAPVDLSGLGAADRQIVNQALGEGEVGAQVADGQGSALVQVQESVFAGVWRVIERLPDGGLQDRIEVGAIPEVLKTCARQDGASGHRPTARLPEGVMNAPTLLQELHDQRQQWRVGQSAHLVNLSLLPLSPADMACLEEQLGTGRVVILSRGYGNCRISSTRVPNTWRVVYYNSQDAMILNSIEVVDMPEVACAAPEDLVDSQQRLREVMAWVNRN